MSYSLLRDDYATYAIDWGIVERLVRSYHRARARDMYSTVTSTSQTDWYNPVSWSMPDIKSVDVDWDRVQTTALTQADYDLNRLAERATHDVRDLYNELKWMVDDTSRMTHDFTDQLAAVQSDNMARINSAVDSYGTQIEVAKFVRDTSADGLMVGASILSGGAGAAVLGAGSSLKGWAKFEDTDGLSTDRRVGAALLTATGSFTFGMFKIGGTKFAFKEDVIIAILQAQWETGVALTEGKSLGKAVAQGSLKLGGPFVDKVFKSGVATKLLDRACVPIAVTVQKMSTSGVLQVANVAPTVAGKWLGKVAQKQVVERGGKALIKSFGQPAVAAPPAPPAARRSAVIENATLTDSTLLDLAIVNMEKGIGRGL